MNYSQIISYIYALLAVGYGTYFFIIDIIGHIRFLGIYNSKKEVIGIIKNIHCYYDDYGYYEDNCNSDIEYTINNIKYIENIHVPNNLKIGDEIKISYNPNDHKEIIFYGNDYIYTVIYIILSIIAIILLWIFLFIVIIFSSIYNKFIFIFYSIFVTIIIFYDLYYIINNNYNYYNFRFIDQYANFEDYTIGIITRQKNCSENKFCTSNIEYSIDGIKYSLIIPTFDYKVGENAKVYYNKDNPEDIVLYDKNGDQELIKTIIYIFISLLLLISLFYSIPLYIREIINNI